MPDPGRDSGDAGEAAWGASGGGDLGPHRVKGRPVEKGQGSGDVGQVDPEPRILAVGGGLCCGQRGSVAGERQRSSASVDRREGCARRVLWPVAPKSPESRGLGEGWRRGVEGGGWAETRTWGVLPRAGGHRKRGAWGRPLELGWGSFLEETRVRVLGEQGLRDAGTASVPSGGPQWAEVC